MSQPDEAQREAIDAGLRAARGENVHARDLSDEARLAFGQGAGQFFGSGSSAGQR